MTWIATVPPEEAVGELAELYESIAAARGGVADIHRAQSLNVAAMKAHLDLYRAIVFQRSSLGRIDRERIAVVVSQSNACSYCIAHHAEALRALRESSEVIDRLSRGEIPSTLPERERLLLRWAVRGAREPALATQRDIEELRGAGYDDRAIADAALTVAYFSLVNRLVLLLGVELESDFAHTCTEPRA